MPILDRLQLDAHGFILVSGMTSQDLLGMVSSLGQVRIDPRDSEPIRDIRPQQPMDANPNTLSSLYGMGDFPFHTDAAHWKNPARFLILHCVNPGSGQRPTYLQDCLRWHWRGDGQRSATHAVWKTGHLRPQLCTLGWFAGDQFRIRFDQACMSPMTARAASLGKELENYIKTAESIEIQWKPGITAVIDNHRMLHARGRAVRPDPDRILQRVLVGESDDVMGLGQAVAQS